MEKTIVVGCGTGRSGTYSLAHILGACNGTNIRHERGPLLPWEFNKALIDEMIENLLKHDQQFVGDVAMYWLNYLEYLVEKYPHVRIVVMMRDKADTVKSFMSRTRGHNHFASYTPGHTFDVCFPNYDTTDRETNFNRWWDDYYGRIVQLMRENKKVEQCLKIYNVESLNTKEGRDSIFEFVGIPEFHRMHPKQTRHNAHLTKS